MKYCTFCTFDVREEPGDFSHWQFCPICGHTLATQPITIPLDSTADAESRRDVTFY